MLSFFVFFLISFFCKSNIVSIKMLFTCNTVHIVGSACLCVWCIHYWERACLCVKRYTLLGECVFVRLGVHIVGRVRVCAFGGTHCWESACLYVCGYTLLGECVFVRLGVHIVGTVRVCALDENVCLS